MLGVKREMYLVDSDDLDTFVHKHYPQRTDWESIAAEEWNNYSCYLFAITGKDQIDQYNFNKLEQFKMGGKTGYHGMTQILLEDFARRGVIPAGNYLIKVYW